MRAITFMLSGKTAFFKKPDVNNFAYFTYNNIHKIALMGILGSIIGLGGYNQQKGKDFPEFYEKLNTVKVSIVPLAKNGHFDKKLQVFNNTTGFYNKDAKKLPCTLNVKEQWLYDVAWQIFILENLEEIEESVIFEKLKDYIINRKCEFIPYLGKNDHIATISNPDMVELEASEDICHINSIFKSRDAAVSGIGNVGDYEFREYMPVELEPLKNHYKVDEFIFTNRLIGWYSKEALFYRASHYNLYFF